MIASTALTNHLLVAEALIDTNPRLACLHLLHAEQILCNYDFDQDLTDETLKELDRCVLSIIDDFGKLPDVDDARRFAADVRQLVQAAGPGAWYTRFCNN